MPRYSLIPVLIATLLLLIAGACGGDESTPSPTPTQDGPAAVAMNGDSVTVHYRGTLASGEEFDSSRDRGPITFFVGSGQMIAGFNEAVHGMSEGEKVTIHLEPDQAYGEYQDDLIFEIPIAQALEGLVPGDSVQFSNGAPGVVLEITDEVVRVDANHPLAGESLTFEIELISIQ